MPVGHLYVFFGEMSDEYFCPLFDWIVCIFWKLSSCGLHGFNYFLLFCWLPFPFCVISFSVHKLASLIRSCFVCFCFLYLLPCDTDLRKHRYKNLTTLNVSSMPFPNFLDQTDAHGTSLMLLFS